MHAKQYCPRQFSASGLRKGRPRHPKTPLSHTFRKRKTLEICIEPTKLNIKIAFYAPNNPPDQISAPTDAYKKIDLSVHYQYIEICGGTNLNRDVSEEWMVVATWNQKSK